MVGRKRIKNRDDFLRPWEENVPPCTITGADLAGRLEGTFSYDIFNRRPQAWAVPPEIDDLDLDCLLALDGIVREAECQGRQVLERCSAKFVGIIDGRVYFIAANDKGDLTEYDRPVEDFKPGTVMEPGTQFMYIKLAPTPSMDPEHVEYRFLLPEEEGE